MVKQFVSIENLKDHTGSSIATGHFSIHGEEEK
jgi:hypothetical protein